MKKFLVTMFINAIDLIHARDIVSEMSQRAADAGDSGHFDRGSIGGDVHIDQSTLEEIV